MARSPFRSHRRPFCFRFTTLLTIYFRIGANRLSVILAKLALVIAVGRRIGALFFDGGGVPARDPNIVLPALVGRPALALVVAFFQEHRRCGDLDGGVEDGRV